jgi:TetR/AcrR family transcriptional repressor of lmrAB and yxaGH operons
MAKTMAERSEIVPVLAEIFRTYGFEGASLARITAGTKLGKGSLYHFFPGGKEEMATAVLDNIDTWFRIHVFEPLRSANSPEQGIADMFREVRRYFAEGHKICVVGLFALANERHRFSTQVNGYFAEWADALRDALIRSGRTPATARHLAEDILIVIQGGLVLARAWDQPRVFMRALDRLERDVAAGSARP